MLRSWCFRWLQRLAATEDAKAIASQTLSGLLHCQPRINGRHFKMTQPLYEELGHSRRTEQTAQHRNAIIVTGRFRSGTTFLWNIFRHLDGITAYYEPFNERRWFDPATRGQRVDQTHKHVEAYWNEYEGLTMLQPYYREAWTSKQLYMDATCWAPEMQRYVELLIEKAPGRPVLQFNRIDLRLLWFRHHFPSAKIIHIYRHPRDQWCSFLGDPRCFPPDGRMQDFAPHDKFYICSWARDLQYHFPFLAEAHIAHPYQLFYFLWKLSYLWGVNFAHYSLAFEDLIDRYDSVLKELFGFVEIDTYDLKILCALKEQPARDKWRKYADEEWFQQHESLCETVLEDFFVALTHH
jgi:Sulfotransferase family